MKTSQLAELIRQESNRDEKPTEPVWFQQSACGKHVESFRYATVRYANGMAGCPQLAAAVRQSAGRICIADRLSRAAALPVRALPARQHVAGPGGWFQGF